MTNPRRLLFQVIAGLIMGSELRIAGALEAHDLKYDAVPVRFFTVIPSAGFAYIEQQPDAPKAKSDDPLPEGKGKDVTKRLCSGCHAVTVFATQRHTAERWAAIVDNMVSKGLDGSDEELATINTYLSTYLGEPKEGASSGVSFEPQSKR